MNEMNTLDRLGPIADEMLAGLHADQRMRLRIREAALSAPPARPRMARALAPAACCAVLALLCAGALNLRAGGLAPQTAQINAIAAGDGAAAPALDDAVQLADLGDGARVGASTARSASLFDEGDGDIPMVTVGGAVYRLLTQPGTLSDALRGDAVGTVSAVSAEPSLASQEEMNAGLSNVAAQGAPVYAIRGLSSGTAVAAEVDGQLRVFQRVSYAGKGPGPGTLEDTFSVRGQVKTVELSGVGTLEGEAAEDAIGVLLDNATLASADASARKQYLTVTLTSGLRLQLGVSGDMLCGCGGWSCPEFFEAFEAAL